MIKTCNAILDFIDGAAFCIPAGSLEWEQLEGVKRVDMWFRWEDKVWAWRPKKDAKFWIREYLDWTPEPGPHATRVADMVRHLLSVPASEFRRDPCIPNSVLDTPTAEGMAWRLDRTFAYRKCEGYDRGAGAVEYPHRQTLLNWFNDRTMPDKKGSMTAEALALDCWAFCLERGFNVPADWIARVALPWVVPRGYRKDDGWALRLRPR